MDLAKLARARVSCYPNAGLPNAFGELRRAPGDDVAAARGVRGERAREHRGRLLRDDARSHPRDRPGDGGAARRGAAPAERDGFGRFGGLETLVIRPDTNFLMIGERTNVTGSARFMELIKKGDFTTALEVALDQVRGGANILDVNMDEGMLDSEQAMTTFLNLVATEPEIARIPIMVDSSKWSVIEAGLKCIQGKGVVNSISLKEGPRTSSRRRAPCGATGRGSW